VDVSLTDDQKDLQESARRLFADRLPLERLVQAADADDPGDAVDVKLWDEVVGLGWADVTAQGGDFTMEAVLLEQAGYALVPVPLLSTLVASPATTRLAVDGVPAATVAWAEPADEGGAGATAFGSEPVRTRAVAVGDGAVLSGRKVDVPDLQIASLVVVAGCRPGSATGALSLYVVARDAAEDTGSMRATYPSTLDGTRRVAHLELVDAPAMAAVTDSATVAAVRRRAFAALAAESVGVAQRALDLAATHASTREQFGRPIASYQAVAHRIADVYVAVELARSLAYRAAYWVAAAESRGDDAETDVACAAAKAAASDAAVVASETLIQVLGGMGMTWEHVAHRLYKRALANRGYAGDPRAHRATIAAALLD
jgi:alkylation response protein AidB-like acyl-CoA dehydrogenase